MIYSFLYLQKKNSKLNTNFVISKHHLFTRPFLANVIFSYLYQNFCKTGTFTDRQTCFNFECYYFFYARLITIKLRVVLISGGILHRRKRETSTNTPLILLLTFPVNRLNDQLFHFQRNCVVLSL